ncbi:hypothetical protein PAESOLCIP111_02943 [Paenibacillus solanacearum]|uniref:Uncharacterized protein n=1 Tax=Paenibacillus solanacearum TaxID=2048548 RepID=A0A916NQ10_9BACL|nr:hypothetical protein [Paenibacillus solanacearum]CAG7627693.1 hypothetical protein PAESOLCIP111_02943 [Paenibacillus solanacearum]
MNKWIILPLALLLGIGGQNAAASAKPKKEIMTEFLVVVKASNEAELRTELRLQSTELQRSLKKNEPVSADEAVPVIADTQIIARTGQTETVYEVGRGLELYDRQHKQMRLLPESAKHKLDLYVRAARQAHYGKLTPWKEAERIVARKAICQVTDLETGLSFQVQRRAGSSHADMQPLTKADTAIMKQIYEGKWSWRRRAVLVSKEGQVLAGSMHGMPHGGDGIPDNDFSGHFCIHFLDSTTHGSNQVDPDHQWMIYKAAGQLDEKLAKASPYEVIDSFLIGLNQQDRELVRRGFADQASPQLAFYLDGLARMKAVKKAKPFDGKDPGEASTLEIPVPVTVWFNGQQPERQVFVFTMKRSGRDTPWKIDSLHPISGK